MPRKPRGNTMWPQTLPCMNSTPPTVRASAAIAPTIGHGLGSTRWYGCLAEWVACESLMACSLRVRLRSRSIDGADAFGGVTHLLLRAVLIGRAEECIGQRHRMDVLRLRILKDRGIDEERHREL